MAETDYSQLGTEFGRYITGLDSIPEPQREGHFRVLGMIAVSAGVQGLKFGSYPEANELFHTLQHSINVTYADTLPVKDRLKGILDVYSHMAQSMPPRITDEEFAILSRIKEEVFVPLDDEVKDFVYPPTPEPDESANGIAVFSAPPVNYCVSVRRAGKVSMVHITPKGTAALEAYFNRAAA